MSDKTKKKEDTQWPPPGVEEKRKKSGGFLRTSRPKRIWPGKRSEKKR